VKHATHAAASVADVRSSAQRQFRAYVGESRIRPDQPVVGEKSAAHITFKNFGLTPAYEIEGRHKLLILPPSSALRLGEFERADKPVLSPKDTVNIRYMGEDAITAEQFADIDARRLMIYLRGELRYKDLFGANRLVTYQLYYNPTLKRFVYGERGNNAN
jgi:hypothetical protein